jgi:hypothetical protein
LRRAGFPGALRVVTEWANRQRLDDKRPHSPPDAKLSARKIARLLMADPPPPMRVSIVLPSASSPPRRHSPKPVRSPSGS